ncbi:hypothetical protein CAEBREN_22325 [Caenorhabditis brenneri]|uniref:CUB-like domain-containing protein n=1 Tax=Caenorhabditis brenneri TaxID=135651 RepID=G0PJP4_CAEBE|nr:hypothetical protein CAEBREN_22325 [Caenorhabditis brenneri]
MYIVLFAVLCIARCWALDCDAIQDSDIYDNNTVTLPKIAGPLPSKFNCTYQVGQTDIQKTERLTATHLLFLQIQAYLAAFSDKKYTGCWDCYVMDGTVEKHSKIYRIAMFEDPTFASTFNAITVFAATEKTLKMVFNPLSEARQFSSLWATESKMSVSIYASPANTQAIEVVNFNSTGITLEDLYINSEICIAYIESGPPNIASRRLLDLSSNPNIPYFFNEKYFTVVIKNCFLEFRMK